MCHGVSRFRLRSLGGFGDGGLGFRVLGFRAYVGF